ncbi:MAG TPA: hypothetical protein PKI11_01455 [Candidatus Hydrogenedentes bacterium]|nr:hypothetical protein [Candidatus Hydrogenedentota bacterium]
MRNIRVLKAAPAAAFSFYDLEILLDVVLQVLNIIARIADIFGINLNFGGGA